jgi:hypothetical protein
MKRIINVFLKTHLFIQLLFILFSTTFYSQNKLSIDIKDCNSGENNYYYNSFELFKNDTLFKKFEGNQFIENLSQGKYYIIYNTYFGKEKTDYFELNDDFFKNEKELCVNFLNDSIKNQFTNTLFFDKIKNNEKIEVKIQFSGCFKSGKDEIVFFKKGNKLFCNYNNKKRKIKDKELGLLREFEMEIRSFIPTGSVSTGNTFYKIKYNQQLIEFTDVGGIWNGFDLILKSLNITRQQYNNQ